MQNSDKVLYSKVYPLKLVHPHAGLRCGFKDTKYKLAAEVVLNNNSLDFVLSVENYRQSSRLHQAPTTSSVPGLWDYDVLEVFLQVDQNYFEFQLSPVNQFFELEVIQPRIKTNPNFQSSFVHSVTIQDDCWTGLFRFNQTNLENMFGTLVLDQTFLGRIKAGFFAILDCPTCLTTGHVEAERLYYASFLPPQERPDFHLPKFFRRLGNDNGK